jgi:hypothetical protein
MGIYWNQWLTLFHCSFRRYSPLIPLLLQSRLLSHSRNHIFTSISLSPLLSSISPHSLTCRPIFSTFLIMDQLFCCNCQHFFRYRSSCPRCSHKKCKFCRYHRKPGTAWKCCGCSMAPAGNPPNTYICQGCRHVACSGCFED